MTITLCEYNKVSHTKYAFKLCIKSLASNIVLQSNNLTEIHKMLEHLNITLTSDTKVSVKYHHNYIGQLECIQTIYYIGGINNA